MKTFASLAGEEAGLSSPEMRGGVVVTAKGWVVMPKI